MRFLVLSATFVVFAFSSDGALAADSNGYTAQYECRAGGPSCNVDVTAFAAQSCNTTITTADSAATIDSKLNGANTAICVESGDYTGTGAWRVTKSGTSATRRVLRYYRAGDNGGDPWTPNFNQAKIPQLVVDAANFWVVHRLTVNANDSQIKGLSVTASSNNIFNRMLVEHAGDANVLIEGGNNNTVQNSVVRYVTLIPGADNDCVQVGGGTNNVVVNNEIYDCSSKGIYTWANGWADGTVIENNDVYVSQNRFSDCNGNPTPSDPNAPCAAFETGIGTKAASTNINNPYRIIHNRVWGGRLTDTSLCCSSGTEGQMVSISDGVGDGNGTSTSDYVLVKDNIVSQGQIAFQHPRTGPHRNSFIGNIVYNLQRYTSGLTTIALDLGGGDAEEIYLNTVVNVPNYYMSIGQTNGDVRCNVFIDAGTQDGSANGSQTQINNNAFYNSAKYTANDTDNNTSVSLKTRASSTPYAIGDFLRVGAANSCQSASDSACFIYRVTKAGTSAGSSPNYCTSLGCTTSDGSLALQAIRGPYVYRRKLRTVMGGEVQVIPYARAHASAPEAYACPSNYASRAGIGISDTP